MNVIQAYQQGGMHKKNNQPCQDRTCYLSQNNVFVIALADGAGSSKYTHSAEGAECVTAAISKFFTNNFDKFYEKNDNEELCTVVKTICHDALKKKVSDLGLDHIMRLSSTLLCAAIKDERVIICHIGDGVIGKLTSEGTKVVSAPDNGEFAGTTYFITNPNAESHIRIIKENLNNTIAYFLMSDGTAEYIYNKFDNCFHKAAKKMALMSFEDDGQTALEDTISNYMIGQNNSSDDCSFICVSFDAAEQKSISTEEQETKTVSAVNNKEKINSDTRDLNRKDTPVVSEMQNKLHYIIALCVVVVLGLLFIVLTHTNNKNVNRPVENVAVSTSQNMQIEESLSHPLKNEENESSSIVFEKTSEEVTTKKIIRPSR